MTDTLPPFEHLIARCDDSVASGELAHSVASGELAHGVQPTLETRVLASPWGAPGQRVPPPFAADEIDALLRLIEQPSFVAGQMEHELPALQRLGWVQGRSLAVARGAVLAQVGQRLYDTLFPLGPVRTALSVALAQARHARAPLPLQLHLDQDAGDLARLPWELLRDEQGYLVQTGRLSLARHIAFKAPCTPLQVHGALHVLVVVSRPKDLATLDGDAEVAALRRSLAGLAEGSGLTVDVLAQPTWRSFVDALSSAPYHVVHFDGHGDLRATGDAHGSARGYLAFERADGSADWRSAENLAAALFRNPYVRLGVLSACRSAAVGDGLLFGGVAPALIGMGVPAVVAMQFEVPLYATVAFTETFYASLAGREPVIQAVAEARAQLDDECWYRPALYLRGRDDAQGQLFATGE
jgi:hypothetical protein